jgi:hypothetical protein
VIEQALMLGLLHDIHQLLERTWLCTQYLAQPVSQLLPVVRV